MASKKTLLQILNESKECFLVPCVYDCSSNHAAEMCGFPVSLLSSGEMSLSMNGMIDYGFSGLAEVEWVVSRISQSSSIPLIVDMEDGYGGPLAVYRAAKRLAMAGAAGIQMEDTSDMENSTSILPREDYMAKVRAALDALSGTDCLLIARTNADPSDPEQFKEGCERLQEAIEIGKSKGETVIAMFVRVTTVELAQKVADIVKGPKIFADVHAKKGPDGHYQPSVTMEELTKLGFCMCSCHFMLKAAMEGMLEHATANRANQSVVYTYENAPATHVAEESASGFFDPQAFMDLENSYTKKDKEYQLGDMKVADYPEGFVRPDIRDRI